MPKRLLEAITNLLPLQFVMLDELDRAHCDAALLFGVSRQKAMEVSLSGLRCLAFIGGQLVPTVSSRADIHLSSTPYLVQCFRGRTLSDNGIHQIRRLKKEIGDEVVARKDDDILWIHRGEGASAVDLVAMEPPDLADKDYLFRHFQRDNWVRLLPILHFLREVSGWEPPPIRACLMFDDPNLHWKSYGYVNYGRLVQHASEHNYHVSFATVPMDAWYVHSATTRLFRENKSRLSLLIHGNNHTYRELTQARTDASRQALAIQALRRIERLERLSGLEVARVMAGPHGACNHEMANVLAQTGFEAASVSRSSLVARNPNVVWPITLGLNVAEFLGGGLPAILRFDIRLEYSETTVLLAAFSGQPIIPCGHHQDFADGLDFVGRIASLVNSVAEVQWMDMQSIAQTNFCRRQEGEVLHIKMYSRKIRLKVPKEIKTLWVQRPWLHGNGEEYLAVQKVGSTFKTVISHEGEPISVTPGDEMMIGSIYPGMIDFDKTPLPRSSVWTVGRRLFCEGRDRLRPTTDRLFARNKAKN